MAVGATEMNQQQSKSLEGGGVAPATGGSDAGPFHNMKSDSHDETESRKRLLALMTRHQRQIFSYIYTLVPNRYDAEDLLQETSLVVCEKFNDFEDGTDFVAWACQIAYWRVRYSRQKFARSKVVFNQEIVDAVAQTASELAEELDDRHDALGKCLAKLHPRDRDLLLVRYEPGCGVEEAARRSGRTVQTAYKALARLRKLLLDCVTTRLAEGGAR
jgi:RNA polymerase sigma-70 factor (ECF subfamily)